MVEQYPVSNQNIANLEGFDVILRVGHRFPELQRGARFKIPNIPGPDGILSNFHKVTAHI